MLTPKRPVEKAPAIKLTAGEQKMLISAKRRIERIRKDPLRSRGLTSQEAKIAAKTGLIAKDQMWWWTEEWQKGERAAERDIQAGRTKYPCS